MTDGANERPVPVAALWLVPLAAAGIFAPTMGTRQMMGLCLSPLNTSTAVGAAGQRAVGTGEAIGTVLRHPGYLIA